MYKILFSFVLFFALFANAGQIIEYRGFTVDFNTDTLCANSVTYILISKNLKPNTPRKSISFRIDKRVRSANPDVFKGTLYDMGHFCAAEDRESNATELWETYYTTNICPETRALNRGPYKSLEVYVRKLVLAGMNVKITTGSLFIYGKIERIQDSIGIPDAIFKVVENLTTAEKKAYLFPNVDNIAGEKFSDYEINIKTLSKLTKKEF